MGWRDRLQDGSFRGVAFSVLESRASFGRRNQTHEFPQRDQPWTEDMGRSARRWSIEAVLVGPDYDLAAEAFDRALEAKGPGTLAHPYLGQVSASLVGGERTDSTSEGGQARYSLQFVEAGTPIAPAESSDTQSAARAQAASTQQAVEDQFAKRFSIDALPDFVSGASEALLGDASRALDTLLADAGAIGDAVFAVQAEINSLRVDALALIQAPITLAARIGGVVFQGGQLAGFLDDAASALERLTDFGQGRQTGSISTPARRAEAVNQAQIIQLVQVSAAAAAVDVLAQTQFDSYDAAAAIRDSLGDRLDRIAGQAADNGDDVVWRAVEQLRFAMVRDLTARGASLARLYAYTPAVTEPALVIAQRLYADAGQAEAIALRNGLKHPLFASGGTALEVLSDV